MNTTQALTQLRKLLGRDAAIQDSKRPSSDEQRAKDLEARLAVNARKAACEGEMVARREWLLANDPMYQELKKAYLAARGEQERTPYGNYYRYTAGRLGSMFFSVEAEGDTLAEVVEKVKAKRAAK